MNNHTDDESGRTLLRVSIVSVFLGMQAITGYVLLFAPGANRAYFPFVMNFSGLAVWAVAAFFALAVCELQRGASERVWRVVITPAVGVASGALYILYASVLIAGVPFALVICGSVLTALACVGCILWASGRSRFPRWSRRLIFGVDVFLVLILPWVVAAILS